MHPVRKLPILLPIVLALMTALATARPAAMADTSPGDFGLAWSTYLGGVTDLETVLDAALDAQGNAYVVGLTLSTDFPSLPPLPAPPSPLKGFLTKFAPDGGLLFSTLLGGVGWATAVALGPDGSIYVAGLTIPSSGFPLVNPLPATLRGSGEEAFVMRLSADGSQILFSTTLGGSGNDHAEAIAVDAAGAVYLAGSTQSSDFPTVNPVQGTLVGLGGGFVTKILPASSTLAWSTYLGGQQGALITDVVADGSGGAIVAGLTSSPDFPIRGALQPALRGSKDAFVTAFGAAGDLVASTYLGGNLEDDALGISRDAAGFLYLGGSTTSSDFPTTPGAFQPSDPNGYDAFAAKLSPDLATLVWSTYLGGSAGDTGMDLAIDAAGNTYLTGVAQSTDFPLRNPVDAECTPASGTFCEGEAFLSVLSADGSSLLFSTYFGGSIHPFGNGATALDIARVVDVGTAGDVVIAGETVSTDFPTTVNAFQPTDPGGPSIDAFAVRFVPVAGPANRPPDCAGATASPSILRPPNRRLVPITISGVTDPDENPLILTVTAIRQDEPRTGKDPDATGVGSARPAVRATRAGGGDGRAYHIAFTVQDPSGAACTGKVKVCVPHDQSGRGCGDGGALFDSTGSPQAGDLAGQSGERP